MAEIGGNVGPDKKKRKMGLRFAAPIQIIVLGPKSEYCKNVWCALGIVLADVALGAVIMSVLHYSLKTGDTHAVVCTLAYNFFSTQAILAFNFANGWSSSLRIRHKRFSHIFLNLCGIVFAIVGTVVVSIDKGISKQAHGITGILAGVFVLLSALFGPFALRRKRLGLVILHMSMGIIAFITSSLCLCLGLVLDPFKSWAGDDIVFILIGLVVFYSVFIITGSFMKCVSRI